MVVEAAAAEVREELSGKILQPPTGVGEKDNISFTFEGPISFHLKIPTFTRCCHPQGLRHNLFSAGVITDNV